MTTALNVLMLLAGLILILKGGDWFVDASVKIAKALKIPELVIGATVVSIGTTLPELLTSLTSVIKGMIAGNEQQMQGFTDIAIGNAVGSMMCNIGLILALVMIIKPQKAEGASFISKGLYLLSVSALVVLFSITGGALVLWEGIILLVLFVAFMGANVYEALKKSGKIKRGKDKSKEPMYEESKSNDSDVKLDKKEKIKTALTFIIGAGCIAGGAIFMVNGVQDLCISFGIPEQIIAVTVVAIGTSLPELVTSITSLRKGNEDIGIGNVVGANIINATLLLGLVSVVTGRGLNIDAFTRNYVLWFMLGITAILVVPSLFTKKAGRVQGMIMMAAFITCVSLNVCSVIGVL